MATRPMFDPLDLDHSVVEAEVEDVVKQMQVDANRVIRATRKLARATVDEDTDDIDVADLKARASRLNQLAAAADTVASGRDLMQPRERTPGGKKTSDDTPKGKSDDKPDDKKSDDSKKRRFRGR